MSTSNDRQLFCLGLSIEGSKHLIRSCAWSNNPRHSPARLLVLSSPPLPNFHLFSTVFAMHTIGLQTRIFGTGPLNLETIWHEQVTRSLNACAMLETRLLCELRPTFGPQFINLPQGCSLSRPAILTWGTQWCLINMTLLMIYGILPPNPHPFRRIR